MDSKAYVPYMHRIKKFGDRYLLVGEQGGWALLDKEKYRDFLRHVPDNETYLLLENKGIIITGRNENIFIGREHYRRRFMQSPPVLHIVVPTLRCNHQCVYCHSSARVGVKGEYDMSIETARKVVDFIMSTPSDRIKIEYQGGDSLLNREVLKEIHDYARTKAKEKKKKLWFSLVTNLTLMDDEMIEWLKTTKITVSTSLDGPKEVHDANRRYIGGKGSFDDVVRQIKKMQTTGRLSGALMVTTRASLDCPEKIIDTYLGMGFRSIQLKYIDKLGFAQEEWEKVGYTAEEYLRFWRRAMEYILKKNKEGTAFKERITELMTRKIITPHEPAFLDLRNPCGVALGQISYDHDGNIYCCDEARGNELFNLGNVHNTSYEEYARNPATQRLVESSILETSYCDTCIYKPYCGQCPVINQSEQGNLIPKLAKSNRCKILKAQWEWIFEKLVSGGEDGKILASWLKNDN